MVSVSRAFADRRGGRGCKAARVAVLLAAGAALVACGTQPSDDPAIEAAPSRTHGPEDGVAYQVLAMEQRTRADLGTVAHAADPDDLAALWEDFGFTADVPDVDLSSQVVIAYARTEDGCPDELSGMTVEDGLLVAEFTPPAGGCIQPLIPTGYAVAVHRATVPATFTVHLEEALNTHADVEHPVELDPYDGGPAMAPPSRPQAPAPTEERGVVEAPSPGEVAVARLDDSMPVWVVNHGDNLVSVLAADAPADDPRLAGLGTHVVWGSAERRFSGGGRYDSYGVSVHGGANLDWYESAVDDDRVTVGRRLGPVPGSHPAALSSPVPGVDSWEPGLAPYDGLAPDGLGGLSPEEALAASDGTVVVVDADLVSYGDAPLRICSVPDGSARQYWPGCADQDPVPAGLQLVAGDPDYLQIWSGPLQVRVADGTLSEVTQLGFGGSGGALPSEPPDGSD